MTDVLNELESPSYIFTDSTSSSATSSPHAIHDLELGDFGLGPMEDDEDSAEVDLFDGHSDGHSTATTTVNSSSSSPSSSQHQQERGFANVLDDDEEIGIMPSDGSDHAVEEEEEEEEETSHGLRRFRVAAFAITGLTHLSNAIQEDDDHEMGGFFWEQAGGGGGGGPTPVPAQPAAPMAPIAPPPLAPPAGLAE